MRRLRPLLLAIASTAAALGLVEGGLRLVGYGFPEFYWPDARLGWVLWPNTRGMFTAEGRAYVSINAAGMRDRDHATAKASGVYRVAVVGDSYSEAMQVAAESTYWARRPAELGCRGRVEVLNFGVAGYGTAQELLSLPRVFRYDPDLVLLQLTPGNDLRNNVRALEQARDRPFAAVSSAGLTFDTSFAAGPSYRGVLDRLWLARLTHASRLLQLVHEARVRARPPLPETAGLDSASFAPPLDSLWAGAWDVTEAMIAAIRDSATAHGAGFLAVSVSYPTPMGDYPDRRLAAFAAHHGLDFLPLTPGITDTVRLAGTPLHGFPPRLNTGHWNAAGHRVAASLIAAHLCARPPAIARQ